MRQRFFVTVGVGLLTALAPAARAGIDDDEKLLAAYHVPTDGPGLLAYFRSRTMDGTDDARLKALVRQLGDDSFQVREQASHKLVAVGPRAREVLKAALKDPDPEIARRAEECLQRIAEGARSEVIAAAVRVLALSKPAGTTEALLNYLPFAEDEVVAGEVRAVLVRVAVRDGKVDPALVAALKDPQPVKREAAGALLARVGLAEYMPEVHKLLDDPSPRVRLRVGLALVAARDKEAVAPLIRLLDQLPAGETGLLEDLLYRLAGNGAPPQVAGSDPATRRKYRQAWEAWWKDNEAKVDPALLAQAGKSLGFTLVVLLDVGQVMELDAANRPRWRIDGLNFPLDVQLLHGGDRILVAEHHGNRVTERDLKGKVLWEYRVEGPLAAQRLPNGNTFITTRNRVMEVDKDGKEISAYTRPGGDFFMKAQKLRNGDIACVTLLGVPRFIRLTPDGADYKEVRAFGVDLQTSGGRIEVLPNGNVLVPEKDNNRVAEYDAEGRVIHEVAVEQPVAAVRLPNGNLLVTSMTQHRAIELTREGKEVWQYRAETRVTRAYRR
jgi:hypothetical protein